MKRILLIPILIFSMYVQAEGLSMLSDLDRLEWENRVVVINEIKNEDESLQVLADQVDDIDDRDIIWFVINDEIAVTNYPGRLSREFVSNVRDRLGPVKSKVTLIGKDGGIKYQSDHLNLKVIFSEIDAMPMRKLEMLQ